MVIALLHSFLGLFQRSVDALKRDLKKIDKKKLTDPRLRNPSLFAQLEEKLEVLTLQAGTARESVENSQGAESLIKTRIAEVDDFLAPTYANWNRVDAGRIVARRGDRTQKHRNLNLWGCVKQV